MKVIHNLRMDLARCGCRPIVGAVQGEANTRVLEVTLYDNGVAWEVPEGVTVAVAFKKPDGHCGLYDTLPDGSPATAIAGSVVTVTLAPQALTAAGDVLASIVFYDEQLNQLATFPFRIRVEANPAAGQAVSNDYYKYTTMADINEAVDAALADLASGAPPIVCEATGALIAVSDASDRPLQGLRLYGKTAQNGTPSPDSPAELVSAGSGGSIVVTVDDQTLTAATPNGLPGIPVTAGGNYTDENGQAWICDEIDFARGVYVQKVPGVTLADLSYTADSTAGLFHARLPRPAISTGYDEALEQYLMCNTLLAITRRACTAGTQGVTLSGEYIYVCVPGCTTTAELQAWLVSHPTRVIYRAATPTKTPMPAEELATYAALHSCKPNTTIYNDAGAGLGVEYVADTKTYIDSEIQTAIDGIEPGGGGSGGSGGSAAIPTKLPNPYALTFTGAVSATYDGSKAVSVEIPQGGGGSGGELAKTIIVNDTLAEAVKSYERTLTAEENALIKTAKKIVLILKTSSAAYELKGVGLKLWSNYSGYFQAISNGTLSTGNNSSQYAVSITDNSVIGYLVTFKGSGTDGVRGGSEMVINSGDLSTFGKWPVKLQASTSTADGFPVGTKISLEVYL